MQLKNMLNSTGIKSNFPKAFIQDLNFNLFKLGMLEWDKQGYRIKNILVFRWIMIKSLWIYTYSYTSIYLFIPIHTNTHIHTYSLLGVDRKRKLLFLFFKSLAIWYNILFDLEPYYSEYGSFISNISISQGIERAVKSQASQPTY